MSDRGALAILSGLLVPLFLLVGCSPTPGDKSPRAVDSTNAAHGDPEAIPQAQIAPPLLNVTTNAPDSQPGFVFINGGAPGAANLFGTGNPGIPSGPEILDKQGRPVWFWQIPNDQDAGNFQVQTYQGKPVLTWFQGSKLSGADYIADTSYNIIKKIAPEGAASDYHEFRLTPDGHALITSVKVVDDDLSGIGGPTRGQFADSIINVVDVASGKTVFQWDSAQHLPVTDSAIAYDQLPKVDGLATPLHVNSIALDPDGNLLLSVRSADELVDVDIHTGAINWVLGGKRSSFTLGPGVAFAGQHDPQFVDADTIMLFNNNIDMGGVRHGPSSIMWIHLDRQHHTATLERNWTQPDKLVTISQGSAQALAGGNTLSGWGDANRITEFAPDGHVVWSANQPVSPLLPPAPGNPVGSGAPATAGTGAYRAFLQQWEGHPTQKPELTISTSNGQSTLHAIWNGATNVVRWRILTGSTPDALKPLLTSDWNGLNTPISLPAGTATAGVYFTIEALDRNGTTINTSNPTET